MTWGRAGGEREGERENLNKLLLKSNPRPWPLKWFKPERFPSTHETTDHG